MPRPGVDFPVDVALDRQRPAGHRQWHHHSVSRHHMVLGAGPARRGERPQAAGCHRDAAAEARRQTRASICGRRRSTSTPKTRSSAGCRPAASICSPSTIIWTSPASRSRRSARGWSNAPASASDAFDQLVDRVLSRTDEVPASIARLAKAANAAGVPTLSHDDATPAMRDDFRKLGVNIAEFPINVETAQGRRRCRRLHRVRRAQCGARRQPYRLDQGVRHDRQGPLLGAGVGLLLSRAIAGRIPAGRRMAFCHCRRPGR